MKKIFLLSFALIFFLTTNCYSARLWTCGFEMQSVTSGVEWNSTTGSPTIDTTTKRSGAASLRYNPSNSQISVDALIGTTSSTISYIRAYVNIATLPNANMVLLASETTAYYFDTYIQLKTDGKLQLWAYRSGTNTYVQVGSDSVNALSTGIWYRIELYTDVSANPWQQEAKVDGNTVISGSMASAQTNCGAVGFMALTVNPTTLAMGNVSVDLYFDDIAVNDTSNTVQTSYPGEGKIVLLLPNAAGDNNPDTGDYTCINEIPPSDTATSGSTMIELDTTTSIGDFGVTDSATVGINSYDTISLIWLLARVREETSGTSNYTLRYKSASGGTTISSTSKDAGSTTVRTNPSSTTAFGVRLVGYTDPTTGVAWTPTGTNSIDNMQIGAATTDGDPDTWVLWLGTLVEYVIGEAPPPTPVGVQPMILILE